MDRRVRAGLTALLPAGSKRRRLAGRVARIVLRLPSPEQQFRAWLAARTAGPDELARQRRAAADFSRRPVVSVCMPVHDPDPSALSQAIASVLAQSYDRWQLCICDDGSTRPEVARALAEAVGDERVSVVSAANGGISRATNLALEMAQGEWVAFLDHDDVLEPEALFRMVEQLQADPQPDVVYSDEDMLSPSGRRKLPFLKPGWSPETLLSFNYITHLVMMRRSLVEAVGGLRPERDGAQDHDLLLRVTEKTEAVAHVPRVLYSWRQSPRSTAMTSAAKPWAYEAGRAAVADALERRHIAARLEPGAFAGALRVRYQLPDPPPAVEILIPTRDRVDLLEPCLESLALTSYPDFTVTVVDNDSRHPATAQVMQRHGVRVIDAPGPFNYAAIMNRALAQAHSDLVVTLNNDTRIVDPDWLQGLVELGSRPDVGAVGCRLVFSDGRPQHEGIVLACGRPAENLAGDAPGLRLVGVIPVTRDVTAVTGACCLMRRSAWEAVGGYDEAFTVMYNDVDFCLRLRAHGYRVLYTPYVTVVHDESSSRGDLQPPEDLALMTDRWAGLLAQGDPYFPVGLRRGRFGLELVPEPSGS